MQYFQWYLSEDGNHWRHLEEDAQHLAHIGITNVWLPPAFKGTGTNDVGYGTYDLFDLGEFDQKGHVRTKYGSKDEYLAAIQALHNHGIRVYADVVLNHKAQGDKEEAFHVLKMDNFNRQEPISEPYEIDAYTYFTFPGRGDTYSDFKWHWYHFSGIDYDARHDEIGIYLILSDYSGWANNESVSKGLGNYDYLMFNDINYSHPEVVEHIKEWANWYINFTDIDGFRLDAIKHIDSQFIKTFVQYIKDNFGGDAFYVFGEYWDVDYDTIANYLETTDYQVDLFDVPLHMNFYQAGLEGNQYDLRKLFDGTLMKEKPSSAVTFVENHDTQAGQSLESTVADWFKPIAYGVILLNQYGLPCVFYGDYYGIQDVDDALKMPSFQEEIDRLLFVRRHLAYGDQFYYDDAPDCIGWVRQGDDDHPSGVAVILSNGDTTEKRMQINRAEPGSIYVDALENHGGEVVIEDEGWATFPVMGGTISAWVRKDMLESIH